MQDLYTFYDCFAPCNDMVVRKYADYLRQKNLYLLQLKL
jgi:hypothetical protein